MDQPNAYTVGAVTRMIKDRLESSFPSIWVEGEISNYINHSSGHRYLNLKDSSATLRVTIWRSAGSYLKFEPENGQKVLAFGDISVYEKGGSYQLNCRKLVPVGVGELELAFRQLKDKLEAEGLFDPSLKKPIPDYATRIGIVTSPTGAAVRDIIQIARRRNPTVELILYPAKVQGDGAENTIAAGLEYFNSRDDIDLIIAGRGGGSLEDLWPFNTEITVRAIAASHLPVISAVGHEIDTTLADLVADLRAPTPSAASELAVWPLEETRDAVDSLIRHQAFLLGNRVKMARQNLGSLLNRPVFQRPQDMINQRQQALDMAVRDLVRSGKNSFDSQRNRLSLVLTRLEALSPLKVMNRGYSVSRRMPKRQLLRSVEQILPGDRMETLLPDGSVVSFVESVDKGGKHVSKEEA